MDSALLDAISGFSMRWRDEFYQGIDGQPAIMTCMDIVNDELDVMYLTNDAVHTMINSCVSFGVKVGAA